MTIPKVFGLLSKLGKFISKHTIRIIQINGNAVIVDIFERHSFGISTKNVEYNIE